MLELDGCHAFTAYGFIAKPKKTRKRSRRDGGDDVADLQTKYMGMTLWMCLNKHYMDGQMVKLQISEISLAGIITCKIALPVITGFSTNIFAEQWHACVAQEINFALLEFKLHWLSRIEARAEALGEMTTMDTISDFELATISNFEFAKSCYVFDVCRCLESRETDVRSNFFF